MYHETNLIDNVFQLRKIGIDPILAIGSDPFLPDLSIDEQIREASNGLHLFNVAVRGAGRAGLVTIQCADPQTHDNAKRLLSGLGAVSVEVAGMTTDLHILCADLPDLSGALGLSVGPGQLIASPQCFTLVPSSMIGDVRYCFVSEPWTVFESARRLLWRDVMRLVVPSLPVALPFREATSDMMKTLSTRHQTIARRVMTLILRGYDFQQIEAQRGNVLLDELIRTYSNAIDKINRRANSRYWLRLLHTPIPIRGNTSAHDLFNGIVAIAYAKDTQPDQWFPAFQEEIQPYVNNDRSLRRGLRTLHDHGLIKYRTDKNGFMIRVLESQHPHEGLGYDLDSNAESCPYRSDLLNKWMYNSRSIDSCLDLDQHSNLDQWKPNRIDAIRFLNQRIPSTRRVYEQLTDIPQSIKQLAGETGFNRDTVSACLTWLSGQGLASKTGTGRRDPWIVGRADVEQLARAWSAASEDWLGKQEQGGDF